MYERKELSMASPPGRINMSLTMNTHLPLREDVEVDKTSDSVFSIDAARKILSCSHALFACSTPVRPISGFA